MNYEEAKMEIVYYTENKYVMASGDGTPEYEAGPGNSAWSIGRSDS